MNNRNKIGLGLTLISLVLLYPGLFNPALSIAVGADLPLVGRITLYEQTQSVVESIRFLNESNNHLVAFLILFFSIVIPLVKAFLVFLMLFIKRPQFRNFAHKFVNYIGKWAMSDVFVVGIFIAFLSTTTNSTINAHLEEGFYYFVGYCMFSIASFQIVTVD